VKARSPAPRARPRAAPAAEAEAEAELASLANLGPKSARVLVAAGIASVAELRRLGSVAAFAKVKRHEPGVTLNLLWAIDAALSSLPWQVVAREHRTSLLLALEQHRRGGDRAGRPISTEHPPMPSAPSKKSTWTKSPPELAARFDAALPDHPALVRKPMFGYPAAFVNGNMVCGLFQDSVVVRLGKEGAAQVVERGAAEPFAPMAGRTMTGYVLVPAADSRDPATLSPWLRDALSYTLTLPGKAAAKKAPANKAVAKKAAGRTGAAGKAVTRQPK